MAIASRVGYQRIWPYIDTCFGRCTLISCLNFGVVAVIHIRLPKKSAHLSCLLVLEVCNLELAFRNQCAANLLVMLDSKVKQWQLKIKMPISRLLLVLDVCIVRLTFKWKPWAANLFVVTDMTLDHFFKVKLQCRPHSHL